MRYNEILKGEGLPSIASAFDKSSPFEKQLEDLEREYNAQTHLYDVANNYVVAVKRLGIMVLMWYDDVGDTYTNEETDEKMSSEEYHKRYISLTAEDNVAFDSFKAIPNTPKNATLARKYLRYEEIKGVTQDKKSVIAAEIKKVRNRQKEFIRASRNKNEAK